MFQLRNRSFIGRKNRKIQNAIKGVGIMYNFMKLFLILSIAGVITSSCASTKLTHTWVHEDYKGKAFSHFLVIGVSDQKPLRLSFEEKFVEQLKQAGVDAVSSTDSIDIPADKKLEKEEILEAVQRNQNDAVIVTHLVGVEKEEVYNPPSGVRRGYYGYYRLSYDIMHRPGYSTTQTFVRLETNVYDVKTEKPIWSGQSETWQPGSEKQIIDEVISLVIKDMRKNGLLPNR
jgi:hypothetical protein